MNSQFSIHGLIAGIAGATPRTLFSDVDLFARAVARYADGIREELPVDSLLDHLIRACESRAGNSPPEASLVLGLVLADLRRVRVQAQELPPSLLDPFSVDDAAERLPDFFRNLDMELGNCSLRIVDSLPPPYADKTFSAMTFDSTDQSMYGIEPGVALRRQSLTAIWSVLTFAHEVVHVAIGRTPSPRLAGGLEEGLADIVGSMFIGRELVPEPVVIQSLVTWRYRYGRPQLSDLYREGLERCLMVGIVGGGLDGLVDIVRRASGAGREVAKSFEQFVLDGRLDLATQVSDSPSARTSDSSALSNLARALVARRHSLVAHPLDVAIAERAQLGDELGSLAKDLDLEVNTVEDALSRLGDDLFLAVIESDRLTSFEADLYLNAAQLRYDCRLLDELLP